MNGECASQSAKSRGAVKAWIRALLEIVPVWGEDVDQLYPHDYKMNTSGRYVHDLIVIVREEGDSGSLLAGTTSTP